MQAPVASMVAALLGAQLAGSTLNSAKESVAESLTTARGRSCFILASAEVKSLRSMQPWWSVFENS